MIVAAERRPEGILVRLVGRMDRRHSLSLKERLVAIGTPGNLLVLDLSQFDSGDSTGLGVLIGTLKQLSDAAVRVRWAAPEPKLQHMAAITGLNRLFPVYESAEAAFNSQPEPP